MTSGIKRPGSLHRLRQWGLYLLIAVSLLPFLFFFYWMVASSLKLNVDITARIPVWFFRPTLDNYVQVFNEQPFVRFLLNSATIGLFSTIVGLIIGLPAAYIIARYRMRVYSQLILLARMAPWVSYLVPWYLIFRSLNLLDTHVALVVAHLVIAVPTVTWIMIGFFEDIPYELEQAAWIDGASEWRGFVSVALPLVRPGLATAAILSYIFSWNNFIFALVLAGPNTRTIPVAVFNFMSYESINWGALAAGATLTTAPVLVLVFFVQRYIVGGLTMGGMKG